MLHRGFAPLISASKQTGHPPMRGSCFEHQGFEAVGEAGAAFSLISQAVAFKGEWPAPDGVDDRASPLHSLVQRRRGDCAKHD